MEVGSEMGIIWRNTTTPLLVTGFVGFFNRRGARRCPDPHHRGDCRIRKAQSGGLALSIDGIAVALAIIRSSAHHQIVALPSPGYIVALSMMFFVPKLLWELPLMPVVLPQDHNSNVYTGLYARRGAFEGANVLSTVWHDRLVAMTPS